MNWLQRLFHRHKGTKLLTKLLTKSYVRYPSLFPTSENRLEDMIYGGRKVYSGQVRLILNLKCDTCKEVYVKEYGDIEEETAIAIIKNYNLLKDEK